MHEERFVVAKDLKELEEVVEQRPLVALRQSAFYYFQPFDDTNQI